MLKSYVWLSVTWRLCLAAVSCAVLGNVLCCAVPCALCCAVQRAVLCNVLFCAVQWCGVVCYPVFWSVLLCIEMLNLVLPCAVADHSSCAVLHCAVLDGILVCSTI